MDPAQFHGASGVAQALAPAMLTPHQPVAASQVAYIYPAAQPGNVSSGQGVIVVVSECMIVDYFTL